MSNQRPLTEADLKPFYVRGMPLLRFLGLIILGVAAATLVYELLI